jgi:hypothetical protein
MAWYPKPSTERDAVMSLSMAASVYASNPNHPASKSRMAEAISNYITVVREKGQSNQPGDFNSGTGFKKVFGIDYNDSPAVRYNKITTFRI